MVGIAFKTMHSIKIEYCNSHLNSDLLLEGGSVRKKVRDAISRRERHSAATQQRKSGVATAYHQSGHHSIDAAMSWPPTAVAGDRKG